MNGPNEPVSTKTEVSCEMLENRLKVIDANMQLGENYHLDMSALLTTSVENLHAMSHFKHDTFSVLDYARDFGSIMKESLKRSCSSSAKYFTSPTSYYPVPETNMHLTSLKCLCLSKPHGTLNSKEDEQKMRQWCEAFRPVRQRTVRRETTMDKAGTLPITLYANSEKAQELARATAEAIELEVNAQVNGRDADTAQEEESEYDSDESDELNENIQIVNVDTPAQVITRSGRLIRAAIKLNL
jgi:hypothetical protein